MIYEQMMQNLEAIQGLERDLMRDLTDEERNIILDKGWEEFLFNHLGFTNEDLEELLAIRAIVSAFYTQEEAAFEKAVRKAPKSIYFVLRDILDKIDGATLCSNKEYEAQQEEVKKEPVDEYLQFMQDLYNNLPKGETPWFNKLTETLHKKLFDIYKSHRNEQVGCSDNVLGGIMTDAVKDEVIKAMVEDLKAGKTVEMTNDEYLEVADFLCEHEDRVFLHNENGNVRLVNL